NPVRTLNKIVTPGAGQVGAYISDDNGANIVPGTTLIFFPDGTTGKKIVLSQKAISTTTPIHITINAAQFKIPTVQVKNPNFDTPAQTTPPYYTVNPTGSGVGWTFSGTAGIAGKGSQYTNSNPAPAGLQVGFIQNTGSISQSVNLQANKAYAVSFQVAQ